MIARHQPPCEKCGSVQVEVTVTIRNLRQRDTGCAQNLVDGQWLWCHACGERWFARDTQLDKAGVRDEL